MTRKIDLWDQKNEYWWGELDDDGSIRLWSKSREYRWGTLKPSGDIEIHGDGGIFLWGKLDGAEIELHDRSGNYYHGKVE